MHRRRYLRTRIRDLPGRSSRRRECAYVALSAMKLQMQLRAVMRRNDADDTHHGGSASIRIGRDNTGRRSSDNNELLAADTVGNLSQPTSYVPPSFEINYDSIAATKKRSLIRTAESSWLPRAMPSPSALQHPSNYAHYHTYQLDFFYQRRSKREYP